jgi:transcriptional regulator with XRE-family HTH domain/quercetin dioxygenase-like cupin family protein
LTCPSKRTVAWSGTSIERFTTAFVCCTLCIVERQAIVDDDAPSLPELSAGSERPSSVGESRDIGSRLRQERLGQHLGVRELSRRVGVSASLISQIELGRVQPSVSTLYSIVQELNLSLDKLFFEPTGSMQDPGEPRPSPIPTSKRSRALDGPVVRAVDRSAIHLGSGVTWANLSPVTVGGAEFVLSTYDVGGESAPADALIRHGGREYGHLLAGRLGVTVGFNDYALEPGDSIAFDSTTPHRLFNSGDEPAIAIWFVIGRSGSSGA